jgi:pimeloyl-ACP methyl ester carboxylesterase
MARAIAIRCACPPRPSGISTDADRLVGLSAGRNGVWNLAYRYPERFATLVAIGGWVMPTAERREAIRQRCDRCPAARELHSFPLDPETR